MDGVNTFFVSWAARQVGLKVALSGLGGDEVFGGYPTFRLTPRVAKWTALARCVPAAARKAIAAAVMETSRRWKRPRETDALRKAVAIWSDPNALPHPYFFTRMLFTPESDRALMPGLSSGSCSQSQDGGSPSWQLGWSRRSRRRPNSRETPRYRAWSCGRTW